METPCIYYFIIAIINIRVWTMVFPYTNQNYIMPSPCKTTIKDLIIILTVILPRLLYLSHIYALFLLVCHRNKIHIFMQHSRSE
jgi:hypothetical protein